MAMIKAILLTPVKNKGKAGDIVSLKGGFFRYLEKIGRALYATKKACEDLDRQRADLEQKDVQARQTAQQWLDKLQGQTFSILSEAGDSGVLYGSVSTRDIAKLLAKHGLVVHPNQIVLPEPLKEVGEHTVRVDLHPVIHVDLSIHVINGRESAA